MTVFQRTPNFSIPSRNGPMPEAYAQAWKDSYPAQTRPKRGCRATASWPTRTIVRHRDAGAASVSRSTKQRWESGGTTFMAAFNDLIFNQGVERHRGRVRARQDPRNGEGSGDGRIAGADRTIPIGTKRICVDTDYYATYNRPNVDLVDVRTAPIEAITPGRPARRRQGIPVRRHRVRHRLRRDDRRADPDGHRRPRRRDARGQVGGGPRTYLGLMTAGFPNMFMITGPGSPSVLSNMIVSIEQHVDWIADCLAICASRRHRPHRGRPRRPKTTGSSTSTRSPTRRSIPRRRPGTWAPTSRASRACSCRISAASAPTGRNAMRSPRTATRGSNWPRPSQSRWRQIGAGASPQLRML